MPSPTQPTTLLELELREQLQRLRDAQPPAPIERFLAASHASKAQPALRRWLIPVIASVLVAILTSSVVLLSRHPIRRQATAPAPSIASSLGTTKFPQYGSVLQTRRGQLTGPNTAVPQSAVLVGRAGYERIEVTSPGSSNCRYHTDTVTVTSATTVTVQLHYVAPLFCLTDSVSFTDLLSTPGVDDTRPTTVSVTLEAFKGGRPYHQVRVLPAGR